MLTPPQGGSFALPTLAVAVLVRVLVPVSVRVALVLGRGLTLGVMLGLGVAEGKPEVAAAEEGEGPLDKFGPTLGWGRRRWCEEGAESALAGAPDVGCEGPDEATRTSRGGSPAAALLLAIALEGGGGVDGAAVAMELINISGAFASGELDATQLILDTQTASETLHSTSVPAFERLRAKNNKT